MNIAIPAGYEDLLQALQEVLRREGKLPNPRAPVSAGRRRRQAVVRALRVAARARIVAALRNAARPRRGVDPEAELAAARLLVDALNGLFPRSTHPPYRINGFHLERWDLRQRQYLPFIGED